VIFLPQRKPVDVDLSIHSPSLSGAVKNLPRSAFDLYTPRWVKGRGTTKVNVSTITLNYNAAHCKNP
jgi:hypothetical protein